MAAIEKFKPFAIKSVVMLFSIFVLSKVLPLLPSIPVAIVWAAMSLLSTFGIMYQVTIRKTHRQSKFVKRHFFARVNSGRMLSFIFSFIFSAACMASILIESPNWNIMQWVLLILAIPVFFFSGVLIKMLVTRQVKSTFQKDYVLRITKVFIGILLCLTYLILSLNSAEDKYDTLLQTLLSVTNHLSNSPSAILKVVGVIRWATESWTSYYISKAGTISHDIYSILKVFVSAGVFFGIANLLSICCLNLDDLKKTVQELPTNEKDKDLKIIKRFAAVPIILPIILISGFIYADNAYCQIKQSAEYTWAEQLIRTVTSQAIFVKDGIYYDKEKVIYCLSNAENNEDGETKKALTDKSKELKGELDDAYDSASNKIDDFLNWYYNLPYNPSELSDFTEENTQTQLQEKFCEKTIEGYGSHSIEISSKIKDYVNALNSYVDQIYTELESCKIDNVPSWVIVPENVEDLPTNNLTYAFLMNAEKAQNSARELGLTEGYDNEDIYASRIKSATSETSSYQKIELKIKDVVSRMKIHLDFVNVLDVRLVDWLVNEQTYKSDLQNAIKNDRDKILEILVQ